MFKRLLSGAKGSSVIFALQFEHVQSPVHPSASPALCHTRSVPPSLEYAIVVCSNNVPPFKMVWLLAGEKLVYCGGELRIRHRAIYFLRVHERRWGVIHPVAFGGSQLVRHRIGILVAVIARRKCARIQPRLAREAQEKVAVQIPVALHAVLHLRGIDRVVIQPKLSLIFGAFSRFCGLGGLRTQKCVVPVYHARLPRSHVVILDERLGLLKKPSAERTLVVAVFDDRDRRFRIPEYHVALSYFKNGGAGLRIGRRRLRRAGNDARGAARGSLAHEINKRARDHKRRDQDARRQQYVAAAACLLWRL